MSIVRDRPIWIAYASLAVYGYVLYGLGPAFNALREDLEVSRAAIGLAGSAFAAGGVAAALLGGRVFHGARHRDALRAGLGAFGVGMVGMISLPSLPAAVGCAALMGMGGTTVLIMMPLVIEARQPQARAEGLSEANLGATAAGIVAPLAIGAATLSGIGWRVGMLLAVPMIIAVMVGASVCTDRGAGNHADAHPVTHGRLPRPFWRWWAAIMTVVATEFCITFWAVELLRDAAGMREGAARAALGVFVAGMTLGRVVGGRLASTRDPQVLLVGSLAVALAGFVVLWSAGSPAQAILGLAVTGTGVGPLFPMAMALAMDAAPGRAPLASARTATGSGLAVLIAPFVLAALADGVGVRPAFLLVGGIVLAGLALSLPPRAGGPARIVTIRVPGPRR